MQEDKKQDGQTTTTGSGATTGTTNGTNGGTTTTTTGNGATTTAGTESGATTGTTATTTDNNGEGTIADTNLGEAVVTATKESKQEATVTPKETEPDYTKGITDYLQGLADERERLKKSQDPEAEKREERRLARNRVISSVGNALSALAWMGAAKGYAPTPTTENSSENPYEQRYKEFIERRDKNKTAYENALQKLQDRETSTRELLQKMAIAKRSADNDEARAAELHEFYKARAAALADKAETDAKNEQEVINLRNANTKSSTARNNAAANASNATAKNKNASTAYINDKKNNPDKFRSNTNKGKNDEYDLTTTTKVTKKDRRGRTTTTETTQTKRKRKPGSTTTTKKTTGVRWVTK